MRSARVFYLLLSVLQFILFLKLIEFVRGAEANVSKESVPFSGSVSVNNTDQKTSEDSRGLFIAPRIKRKKLRPWTGGSTDDFFKSDIPPDNTTSNHKSDISLVSRNDTENIADGQQVGRLCPGCENNQCAVTDPISAGFPVVPFVIAIVVGIAWFVLFLLIWIFYIKPDKHEEGGYGGYSSPQPVYGAPSYSSKPSFLDKFFSKPHSRSFESYTQMLNFVLDSIEKLTDIYNDS